MPIITQAETVDAYSILREDLLLVGYASTSSSCSTVLLMREGENWPFTACWSTRWRFPLHRRRALPGGAVL